MALDLAAIGQTLRKERENKSLTVEQVSESLCLRKSTVTAIESGDWAPLPSEVYVRGYVTEYAKYLRAYDLVAPYLAKEKESPTITSPEPENIRIRPKVRQRRERPRLKKGVLGASLAVVAVITLLLYFNGQREVPLPPQYENVSRNSSESQPNLPGAEIKKLMIACHERTWIRILIDGTEKKEVMLNPEEIVVFTAKDTFDLLVGNAGGVKLYYNGKETRFAGESGEVKRVTLP